MEKQITILTLIDIPSALAEQTLENNIYLLDSVKAEGSTGEGAPQLTTAVNGYSWIDGSQACEVVLNWFTTGIGALPITLSRAYCAHRSKKAPEEIARDLVRYYKSSGGFTPDAGASTSANHMADAMDNQLLIMADGETVKKTGVKMLNIYGQPAAQEDHPSTLNYLSPKIVNIRGEAVERNVIFPAMYSSAIEASEGWYWSATVSTMKAGTYSYILDVALFRKEKGNVWKPELYAFEAKIKISTEPMINGFTGKGVGYLPVS
jgi:hypothetical protein